MHSKALGSMLRVSRCCRTYRAQVLKDCDIRPGGHLYISHACRHPGSTQEEFAREICVDKTTAAHILRHLEEKGYIERKVSPKDARCRCIYPTQKALDIYPAIHAAFDDFTDRVMDGLTEEEQQELTRLTGLVDRNARRLLEEPMEEAVSP